MARPLGSTFASLANPHFRILWAGTFFAFIAFFMATAVQSVVAFDLSGNNRAVGFVVFAQGVAQMLLNPFGGALADRMSKKLLISICQAVITFSFAATAILIVTGHITIELLAAGSFLIGSAFSFLGPARQGLTVELVGPALRGNAIALSQVSLNASRIAGPFAAAAFLAIGALGPEGAYFFMMALYVGALLCTWRIPATPVAQGVRRSFLGEVSAGISYVARTPRIRGLVLAYILIIMCGFPYISVLPGLLENELDRRASDITILLVVNAIGGLIASLGVASLADSPRAPAVYTLATLVFGLALVASGVSPAFWVLVLAMFFVGFGGGGFQTLNGALVSHLTEPAYFGRVISLTFLAFAASSVIALPVGIIADAIGERWTITISGLAVLGVVAAFEFAARLRPPLSEAPAGPRP